MAVPDPKPDDRFFGISAKASLWLLLPRVAAGIAVSTGFVFVFFWLRFGEVNSFTALIAGAAALFQILLVIGLRHSGKVQRSVTEQVNDRPSKMGAFWLIAVFFGPILGWFTSDLAANFAQYAIPFHIATVLLTMVIPIVTSIPNYRYVTFANAHITLPMLFIVSLLPSLVGWPSMAALWMQFFK